MIRCAKLAGFAFLASFITCMVLIAANHPSSAQVLPSADSGLTHSDSDSSEFSAGLRPANLEQRNEVPRAPNNSPVERPPKVDLSEQLPAPGDQGDLETCAVWAAAYMLRTFEWHSETGVPIERLHPFSPAFVYHELNHRNDSAVSLYDALYILKVVGTVSSDEMGYDKRSFTYPPSRRTIRDAARYRIYNYLLLENIGDIVLRVKDALIKRHPVAIAARVPRGFPSLRGVKVKLSTVPENSVWHALVVVGYDETEQAFRVINSYGEDWGLGGYAWISYVAFSTISPTEHYVIYSAQETKSEELSTQKSNLNDR
jgi:hypothetical protein